MLIKIRDHTFFIFITKKLCLQNVNIHCFDKNGILNKDISNKSEYLNKDEPYVSHKGIYNKFFFLNMKIPL